VISCFPTNPIRRRRPIETADDVQDRKAFRLCVNAADHERLLERRAWSDSVRVSDWFRSKNNRPNKRRRINDPGRDRDLRSAAASSHGVASGGGASPVDDVTAQHVDGADGAQGLTATVPAVDTATVATVMDIADVEHPAVGATECDHDVHSDENDETTIYQYGVC